MTFYSPLAFIALVAVPIIILLYILKQRHQDYTVSSLYLWDEVLKDIEANAPWQKLRKNILMILQIIAVVLLVLALSKPFITGIGGAKNVIIAIDDSMSMQAEHAGKSRFDQAKARSKAYIESLKPGTLITLISAGKSPVIEENLTSNRNNILEKISGLKVTNSVSNPDDFESLITSVIKQQPDTDVVIFGDREFNIPYENVSYSIDHDIEDNYAVTLLSHSITQKGISILCKVANHSTVDVAIPLSLYIDGKVFDAKNVEIKKNATADVYWNAVPKGVKLLEVRIDKKDSLDVDNRAWNAVNSSKVKKVLLVSEGNVFIEKFVSLSKGIEIYKGGVNNTTSFKGYDLYIFDGFIPKEIPSDGNILIFNPQKNDLFPIEGEDESPIIERLDPDIYKYINDYDFSIGKTKVFKTPSWAKEIIKLKSGSAGFSGQYKNRRILALGFDLHDTDLPLTKAFPIFMTNIFEWLLPSAIENVENAQPGDSINFSLNPMAKEVYLLTPSGRNIKIAPPFPALTFDDTGEVGIYTLNQKTDEGDSSYSFAVNPPSKTESDILNGEEKYNEINNNDKISNNEISNDEIKESNKDEGSVKEKEIKKNKAYDKKDSKSPLKTGMNLQRLILGLLLFVLLIEWWVYSNGV